MAKKDFDREFAQVEAQYLEMVQDLKDMESEYAEGMVSPETYEQMKQILQPIVTNYNMWSYVKFILDKPVRKEKLPTYVAQSKKLQAHMKTLEQVKEENQEALNNLAEYK